MQPLPHDQADLSDPPPLAGMCALAAFLSMLLNQLLVPGLPSGPRHPWYTAANDAGRYAENLTVVAGLIALLAAVLTATRSPLFTSLRRRLVAVVLLTVLVRAVVIATLFDRAATTRESVYYAVGAANVLSVYAGAALLNSARSLLTRLVAGLATSTPLIAVLATTLDLVTDLTLDPWAGNAHQWITAIGEVSYLILLLVTAALVVPRELTPRAGFARSLGLVVLVASLLGITYAQRTLAADYSVFLYYAQRVSLLLDRLPIIYALPIGAAAGAALSAVVAGGARFQAGAALLLLLSAGNAPAAPGRLLGMTLGFLLLSRALTHLDSPQPSTATVQPASVS